jgi:hypothetical protein
MNMQSEQTAVKNNLRIIVVRNIIMALDMIDSIA